MGCFVVRVRVMVRIRVRVRVRVRVRLIQYRVRLFTCSIVVTHLQLKVN